MVHALTNAILNKTINDLKNCALYLRKFPCVECAKLIVQSGIKKIVYLMDPTRDTIDAETASKILQIANIEIR